MARLKLLMEKYGRLAIWTYLTIYALTFLAFWGLISLGIDLESYSSWFASLPAVGTVAVAYAATKLTQPLRIALCLILVPFLHRLLS